MASAAPVQMIDDDDDFDWEAAVRAIDVAYEEAANKFSSTAAATTTTSATPFGSSNLHMDSCPKTENNKPTSSRQSTLDRYIGFTGLKSVNQDARHDAQDKAECDDERVSSVSIDHEAAKTWIYPENVPVREYQVSITRTALFSNTLVSLPTGLGKTLIAAVVMYNYFRWFPDGDDMSSCLCTTTNLAEGLNGKIVFAAPSRPLVMQQIEACHNIVGIPQEWTVDMTGQTTPAKRADLWKAKRIFFVTPQVLEKDIQSGSCVVKQLVCLVIDEAHRASGNYSYCVAVRELMAVPVQLRILALTATPGSNHQTVQQVIDNLQISSLEHRSESDPDVTPYVHDRKIELIQVAMGKDALEANSLLMDVIRPSVARLSAMGVLPKRDIQTLSPCDFLNSRDKFRQAPPHDLPQFKYREVEGIFGALITLYHIRKLLSVHGVAPAYEMLKEKLEQGSLRLLSSHEALQKVKGIMEKNVSNGVLSPKFTKMIEVLIEHFSMYSVVECGPGLSQFVSQLPLFLTSNLGMEAIYQGPYFDYFGCEILDSTLLKLSLGLGIEIIHYATYMGFPALAKETTVAPETHVNTRFQSRIDAQDGKIEALSNQNYKEGEGSVFKRTSENDGYDSSEKNLDHGLGSFIRNNHFETPIFSMPKVKVPVFEGVNPRDANVGRVSVGGGRGEQYSPQHKCTEGQLRVILLANGEELGEGGEVRCFEEKGNNDPVLDETQDPQKSRVIIFSNFRGSKFRAGQFNVIVATSIGEEGLDIMEVDLVICFDANVSPLRMIQRMGRTGRKNEGRVPHVVRPEKRLVKLLIEEFVPRGKKVKDDNDIQTPKYKAKLTDAETDLIAKYFHPSRENNWRPSLIAFPHFQAFPSRVHEDEETLADSFRVESVEHHNSNTGEDDTIREELESDILLDTSRTEQKHNCPPVRSQDPPIHSFLFGSDFMSVDSLGTVLILSVPSFPLQQVSPPKSYSPRNTLFLNCSKSDINPVKVPCGEYPGTTLDVYGVSTTLVRSQGNDDLVTSSQNTNDLREDKLAGEGRVLQTEISNIELFNTRENPCAVVDSTHSADESSTDSRAADLSPRLTNLLMCGVVPESPIDNGTSSKLKGNCTTPDVDMLPNAPISLVQSKNDEGAEESTPNRRNVAAQCMQGEIQTPRIDLVNGSSEKGISASKSKGEIRTPVTNLYDNSCSKDWILTSGEKSVSGPKHRLKRLRKYGDTKSRNLSDREEIAGHTSVSGRSCARLDHASHMHRRASGDEDVDNGQDSYDGSFIDDRINPTVASTQAEAAECDMMALYRRSLLSQTPIQRSSHLSVDLSPDNAVPIDQMHDSGSAVGITNPSLHTSHMSTIGDSSSVPLNTVGFSSTTLNGIRKRKLSFSQGGSPPIRNLEKETFFKPETGGEESTWQGENMDAFEDDEFYQGIDLDALEEEATKQLRSKSELMNEKPNNQNLDLLDCPSFDLGI
ncbi:DNA/RNA helicase, DEAD/DEAH box type, N-terminal [Cynara cardunculus var. scolymus]|uniref:DNA/RNA helicase, DEAD/DEAH box type, N-terminal n=1 Tax=Cynara cardunculus var. scolymus TaxID=59895 RepID=A0A103XCR9_CYNCS|nr:DNA/RNA helicase, DEAD/DEAH box type, N-terminal [Cynara cardunculus var. scolymus]